MSLGGYNKNFSKKISLAMSQSMEELELELSEFKKVNSDWMTDKTKMQIVASYNYRLAGFQGKLLRAPHSCSLNTFYHLVSICFHCDEDVFIVM